MEKFQEVLLKIGVAAAENKYLSAIKNAFQSFLPFTIIGAIGVLWSNVIVNSSTGLGALVPAVMALEFLNPAFNALNFATISCITLSITFLIASELAEQNKMDSHFCGLLALASLLTVTQSSYNVVVDGNVVETVSGIFSKSLGTEGLFTGMIVAIVSVELFSVLFKVDALKIKLPSQVPAQIARSFEYIIPGFIVMIIISVIGLFVHMTTGYYINDLIFNMIQTPLLAIGGSLPGIIIFTLISGLFWAVGLHGDNMIAGVFQPIVFTLIAQNQEAVLAGNAATNIVNWSWFRVFACTGGTGMVIALSIACLIVAKRAENRTVAKLALAPNMFNIGEVNMFGMPVVLNPLLIIPFIVAPIVSLLIGYLLTVIGFCPIMYINVPWTMPPFLYGFIATGGNIMGGVSQLIAIAACVVIYLPFVKLLENQQNKLEA